MSLRISRANAVPRRAEKKLEEKAPAVETQAMPNILNPDSQIKPVSLLAMPRLTISAIMAGSCRVPQTCTPVATTSKIACIQYGRRYRKSLNMYTIIALCCIIYIMKERKLKVLIFLAVLSGGILLISNIVATKLWSLFGIAVDGGLVIFPLSYILGDLIVELYGRKTARTVIWASFAINVLAVLTFALVSLLPTYDGTIDTVSSLGLVPRIVAGSLVAYVASQLLNNLIFEKIKNRTGKKLFTIRALGSSAIARLIDSAIFETIAFVGVLSFGEFLAQASFAYIAGMALEVVLVPLTYLIAKQLSKIVAIK